MRKKVVFILFIFLLFSEVFCISSSKLLKQELARKEYQVKVLKKSCERQKLKSTLTKKADKLYEEYQELKERNKEKRLHKNIDKAFILYRLALSLNDLEQSKKQHERQVESLQLTRKQLEYLKEELHDLKLELKYEK
ncbi:MAG: hypothetical protein K8R49_03875 [Candidatus Cloacimonetes bacterium]|nr:hypothetical protein [Candidatus Cloacimonadota bacterium]